MMSPENSDPTTTESEMRYDGSGSGTPEMHGSSLVYLFYFDKPAMQPLALKQLNQQSTNTMIYYNLNLPNTPGQNRHMSVSDRFPLQPNTGKHHLSKCNNDISQLPMALNENP